MSTVHTGTVWQVPCPLVGGHTYRRPVVSIDVANDLEREVERLRGLIGEACTIARTAVRRDMNWDRPAVDLEVARIQRLAGLIEAGAT